VGLLPAIGTINTRRTFGSATQFFFGIDRTTAGGLLSPKHAIDYGRRTTYPGAHVESLGRTIPCAGATFHTGVSTYDLNFAVGQAEDGMGAYQETHATPCAFLGIKLQGDDIPKINQPIHHLNSLCEKV